MSNQVFIGIDDSGTASYKNAHKGELFTLCASIMTGNNKLALDQVLEEFRNKWGKKLYIEIPYLHNLEIDNGIQRHQGKYAQLGQDQNLKQEFIIDLADILRSGNYKLISISFKPADYLKYMHDLITERYYSRGEFNIKIKWVNKDLYNIVLMMLLRELFVATKSSDHLMIKAEEKWAKQSDFEVIGSYIETLFSTRLDGYDLQIAKTAENYDASIQIPDLCATTINRYWSRKSINAEYKLIQDKFAVNKLLEQSDYELTFGKVVK